MSLTHGEAPCVSHDCRMWQWPASNERGEQQSGHRMTADHGTLKKVMQVTSHNQKGEPSDY